MKVLSDFFLSLGINPMIGAFILGVICCAVARVSGSVSKAGGRLATIRQPHPTDDAPTKTKRPGFITSSINIKVQGTDLAPDVSGSIMDAIHNGNKIEAIKLLREATELDLTQAKALIDTLEKSKA